MRSVPIVAMQPLPEHGCASRRRRKRTFVSPFTKRSLNKAFGSPIRTRSVRARSNVSNSHVPANLAKGARDVRRAIVGHNALNSNAALCEPSDCALNKCRRSQTALVIEDLHICNARGIVNAYVSELPANSSVRISTSIAGDSMPNTSVNSTQFLDVDVNEFSRLGSLITNHRLTRVHAIEPRDSAFFGNPGNRSTAATNFCSDAIVGPALPAKLLNSRFQLIRHRRRHFNRARRAIAHSGLTLKSIALDPLKDGRSRKSKGFGNLLSCLAPLVPPNDCQSTPLRKLRVLMAHHTTFSQEAADPHLQQGVRNLLRDYS